MAHRKVVLCLLGAALATSMISGCSGKKSDPVTVTVWTYYNGDQLDAFNDLTEKFNDTVGKKDGITVETKSLGTAEDLEQNVLAAVNGEVGASEVPNIFSAYSDTAYTMDQKDMLVDLSGYLTDKEKDKVEFLCNECCWFGCYDRKNCYEIVSRQNLGEDCPDHVCVAPDSQSGYRFSKAMENPAFISVDDIRNTYMPMGFSNFKIEGRGLGSALVLEFLLYYMIKPEYQIHVREEIYLDNMLDIF